MSTFEITEEPLPPEPNWTLISHRYAELQDAALKLSYDLKRYNDALNELDGAGTSISNGKERIFALREDIARLEAAKGDAEA